MPEGDTVLVAATRLRRALRGERLTKADVRVPRYATVDLAGRMVEDVVARGKHLLFRIEGGTTLHTHFKMDGAWHLYRHGQRWRGPGFDARVVLETDPWVAVGFRLPVVDLLATADEGHVIGHLGPDVLGDDWDADEVLRRMRAREHDSIGDLLLDQRVIAGLGNVYKSEICFLSGVDPSTPVRDVRDLDRVVSLAKRVVEANRDTGMQTTTGDDRPGRRQWVYGRGGKACRRCGTPIRRSDGPGQRVTFWCPGCQR